MTGGEHRSGVRTMTKATPPITVIAYEYAALTNYW